MLWNLNFCMTFPVFLCELDDGQLLQVNLLMRKTWIHLILIIVLLLTSSGVQLMACVTDPTHQACEGHPSITAAKKCSHSHHAHHDETPVSKDGHGKNPLQPLACVQACSAGHVLLKPEVKIALLAWTSATSLAATRPDALILSSEPASIFHPPA